MRSACRNFKWEAVNTNTQKQRDLFIYSRSINYRSIILKKKMEFPDKMGIFRPDKTLFAGLKCIFDFTEKNTIWAKHLTESLNSNFSVLNNRLKRIEGHLAANSIKKCFEDDLSPEDVKNYNKEIEDLKLLVRRCINAISLEDEQLLNDLKKALKEKDSDIPPTNDLDLDSLISPRV